MSIIVGALSKTVGDDLKTEIETFLAWVHEIAVFLLSIQKGYIGIGNHYALLKCIIQ